MTYKIGLFKKVGKDLIYTYNGTQDIIFTKSKDGCSNDTVVMVIVGLNHFLHYVQTMRTEKEIIAVEKFIVSNCYGIINMERSIKTNSTYEEDIKKLIIDTCAVPPDHIMDIIAEYVVSMSVLNVNESKALTDVTVTNKLALVFHVISVTSKFSYVFTSICRGSLSFITTVNLFVDKVFNKACEAVLKANGEEYDRYAVDSLATDVDEYFYKLVAKEWNSVMQSNAYADKFRHIGIDQMVSTKKNQSDIISALKKYVPVAVTDEVSAKYTTKDKVKVYWTSSKPLEDFMFVAMNTTVYVTSTMSFIIKGQDTKRQFQDSVNVSSILMSTDEESSQRRDNSLYEDKEGHLLNVRKSSALALYKLMINEIESYDDFNLRYEIEKFNIDSNHPFNQFILTKVFLTLTGEQRVYKELFGVFGKIILALFYIKVCESEDLNFMFDYIDIMHYKGKPNIERHTLSEITGFLNSNGAESVDSTLFRSIIGAYRSNDNSVIELSAPVFYRLFKYLQSPTQVRNLLLPSVYKEVGDSINTLDKFTTIPLKLAHNLKDKIIGGIYD